ncbi:hypothetical protein Tco_1176440 [Tanacetum coccineum]
MPKVDSARSNEVLIEEWVSDNEDVLEPKDSQTTVKLRYANNHVVFVKSGENTRYEPVKSDKQAKKPRVFTQSPKVDRKDWNGKMTQKLGLGFGITKKVCFVCGSYNHLIKDIDFHEKRMATKSVLKDMGKDTGYRAVRPAWNSAHRINHQNKFVPSAVLTKSRRVLVNTAGQKAVNPQQALKNKGIFDSGCSRHMTGNKDFLTDYQDTDGGFVAFDGSTRGGKITGKGKIRTVTTGNQTNKNAGPLETNGDTSLKKNVDDGQPKKENVSTQQYIMLPLWSSISSSYQSSDEQAGDDTADDAAGKKTVQKPASKYEQTLRDALDTMMGQEKEATEQSDTVRK